MAKSRPRGRSRRRKNVPAYVQTLHVGSCPQTSKASYISRGAAKRAVQELYPGARLETYKCEFCDHFHFGHRPRTGG